MTETVTYFKLTDRLRQSEIIKSDGNNYYQYLYDTTTWVKTKSFDPYLKKGTELYKKYTQVNAESVEELLSLNKEVYSRMYTKAHREVEKHIPQIKRTYIEQTLTRLPLIECKIVCLYYELCMPDIINFTTLNATQVTPRIKRSIIVLMRHGTIDEDMWVDMVAEDELAYKFMIASLDTVIAVLTTIAIGSKELISAKKLHTLLIQKGQY